MDIASIAAAYQGLKSAKEVLSVVFDAKVDAEAKPKVLEALQKLGDAQDALFAMREELFKLQEANNALRQELADSKAWQARADQYELVKTSGGAVVYKFKGEPEHYACPSCFNTKQVHILQTNRTLSGKYRCTGCSSEFPVQVQRKVQPGAAQGGGPWT